MTEQGVPTTANAINPTPPKIARCTSRTSLHRAPCLSTTSSPVSPGRSWTVPAAGGHVGVDEVAAGRLKRDPSQRAKAGGQDRRRDLLPQLRQFGSAVGG